MQNNVGAERRRLAFESSLPAVWTHEGRVRVNAPDSLATIHVGDDGRQSHALAFRREGRAAGQEHSEKG